MSVCVKMSDINRPPLTDQASRVTLQAPSPPSVVSYEALGVMTELTSKLLTHEAAEL